MNNSPKTDLETIRGHIKAFAEMVRDYPEAEAYKETLARLQQQEADIVNKIGRK